MSLERVVRPFQRDDVFTARVLAPTQPALAPNTDNPEITWQGEADNSVAPAPDIGSFKVKIDWKEDETQRQTQKVKLKNPDDSEQYIEIERITRMVMKNDVTGETIPIEPKFSDNAS